MNFVDDLLGYSRQINTANNFAYAQSALRRAGSGAYYAVFHAFLMLTAESLFGNDSRRELARLMFSRSINHSEILGAAFDVGRHILAVNKQLVPSPGTQLFFGEEVLPDELLVFCRNFPELQRWRHKMDYEITKPAVLEEVEVMVKNAEESIAALRALQVQHPEVLIQLATYVLFSKKVRTK